MFSKVVYPPFSRVLCKRNRKLKFYHQKDTMKIQKGSELFKMIYIGFQISTSKTKQRIHSLASQYYYL